MRGSDFTYLARIDIDMNDLDIGTKGRDFASGPIVEPHPGGNQQVAGFEGHIRITCCVHTQHADGPGVIGRHVAQTHEGHGGGNAALFRQLHHACTGAGVNHATAHVENGTLGGVDISSGTLDVHHVKARSGVGLSGFGKAGKRGHLVLDVLGDIDEHRSWTARAGNAKEASAVRLASAGLQVAESGVMAIVIDDEKGVKIRLLGIVSQRVPANIDHLAAGTTDHGMRRCYIPFRGRPNLA